MRIIERLLTSQNDHMAGYLAYPERTAPGPALLLIHPKSGITDYMKTETRKFAKLGYATFAPNVFELLGYPAVTHIETGSQIQAKTSDAQFVEVLTQAWRYLLSRPYVDINRVACGGYCMGGRIGIHFVAATPEVRAFVGYYPTVRDEPKTAMRPRWPWEAAEAIRCPSIILYGAHDHVTTVPIQEKMWRAFLNNGQPLEWHFYPFGGHGFVDPGAPGYHPHAADLAWPMVVDFLERELVWNRLE
ncbi:MAG TPA: dienelactone hydrolase family protein [Candidatus Acidoferrales bacterium]|nr:dienelactone hydrolase family protein [Candidatus Acidoferrales bacterium]